MIPDYNPSKIQEGKENDRILDILAEYQAYKANYAQNIEFDPTMTALSMEIFIDYINTITHCYSC